MKKSTINLQNTSIYNIYPHLINIAEDTLYPYPNEAIDSNKGCFEFDYTQNLKFMVRLHSFCTHAGYIIQTCLSPFLSGQNELLLISHCIWWSCINSFYFIRNIEMTLNVNIYVCLCRFHYHLNGISSTIARVSSFL